MRTPCIRSERRSSRASSGRITGYWLPKLARKSSVSWDWFVWLYSDTPDRKPCGASLSRQRYEIVEWPISAPQFHGEGGTAGASIDCRPSTGDEGSANV